MRVIAGSKRSLKLKTPPGDNVRPTTDRIKETLFNILNPRIYDCDFLDLFCGSGGIGIEALSRGANSCMFVDSSNESLKYTKDNLKFTGLENNASVLRSDAAGVIRELFTSGKRFDIVFMDPPYSNGLEKKVLEEISRYDILKEDGIIIVEAAADTDFSYLGELGFIQVREKNYGSNKHLFIEFPEKDNN